MPHLYKDCLINEQNHLSAVWIIDSTNQPLMSFDREALTKTDDFFEGATIGATVVGLGQMIYWKQCTIKVFKSGDEKTPMETIEKCDGQALVKRGTSLLLEEGKVKEV